jgi:hypothetical protein
MYHINELAILPIPPFIGGTGWRDRVAVCSVVSAHALHKKQYVLNLMVTAGVA